MRRLRTIILAAAGVAVLAAAVPAAAGAADHARRCTRDITVTHGNGWADADLDNTCADPGWVWANFPAAPHFTMFGPHHVAPPATDSDVGFGGDGWGTPTCGGFGLWYNHAAHYHTTFGGSCGPA